MADGAAALAVAAAAQSHRSWSAACSEAAGGSVRRRGGGLLCHMPDAARGGAVNVLFAERPSSVAAVADELLGWMAEMPRLRTVGWWTTGTEHNRELAAPLLARGWQWGWRPHWMWLDLTGPRLDRALPDGIVLARFPDDEDAPGLPAHARAFGAKRRGLTHLEPPRTTVFAAFDDRAVVGSVTVHLTTRADEGAAGFPLPLAGLYDCWVEERLRRRGIGSALTAAAAARARDLGCRLAVLNATDAGERMYRRVGFESAGWGQTWWLVERQLRAPRPAPAMVGFVEAIGRGDLTALDVAVGALRADSADLDLDAPLLCGETPLAVAAEARQPAAAQRLVELGARLDVVTAWDLGWTDQAARMLREEPDLASRRGGEQGATPLMVAVERDDEALARLVLSARPDLGVRDREYGSTALGWAEHLGRPRLAALIREAAALEARGETGPDRDG